MEDAVLTANYQRISRRVIAEQHLALTGYDAVYGARPLKRLIQREILNPLAMKLLDGSVQPGQTVEVDAEQGRLVFR